MYPGRVIVKESGASYASGDELQAQVLLRTEDICCFHALLAFAFALVLHAVICVLPGQFAMAQHSAV